MLKKDALFKSADENAKALTFRDNIKIRAECVETMQEMTG